MRISRALILFLFVAISLPNISFARQAVSDGFVEIRDVIPSIVLDMRYYSSHNFIGTRIDGYLAPKAYLTENAALALKRVQEELLAMSLSLKIYDSYRPQRAVDHFVRWAEDLSNISVKDEFFPGVEKRHLFRDGYISARSGHTRGSTLDLTIVPLPLPDEPEWSIDHQAECSLPVSERYRDNSLDMGTGYDCFDTLSWTAAGRVTSQQRANRLLLKGLMEKHGFRNYPKEWWHYSLIDEPFPDTYFDFPIE